MRKLYEKYFQLWIRNMIYSLIHYSEKGVHYIIQNNHHPRQKKDRSQNRNRFLSQSESGLANWYVHDRVPSAPLHHLHPPLQDPEMMPNEHFDVHLDLKELRWNSGRVRVVVRLAD